MCFMIDRRVHESCSEISGKSSNKYMILISTARDVWKEVLDQPVLLKEKEG